MTSPQWSEFFNKFPVGSDYGFPFKEKRQEWINGVVIEYEVETEVCPVSWQDLNWDNPPSYYSKEIMEIEQKEIHDRNWWNLVLYRYKKSLNKQSKMYD